jgi:hypothetical protein
MKPDLVYEGQRVYWRGNGSFRATSGLPVYQHPQYQCLGDAGPIPEGTYTMSLQEDSRPARDDGTHTCNLAVSSKVQTIPRGTDAGECEPIWANWGRRRIRLNPANPATAAKCRPRRGGFYIHDSSKGYTHGCIEVDGAFFETLRTFVSAIRQQRIPKRSELILEVRYFPARQTNGGTGRP